MHPCLAIQEIFIIICSFVLRPRDLLSLALTCKSFKDPALSGIWEELWELDVFLRLFPSDSWRQRVVKNSSGRITIESTRRLRCRDWSRVIPYTRWVRRLFLFGDIRAPFLPFVVRALRRPLLFPNLQEFESHDDFIYSCIPFLRVVLSPNITHLSLPPPDNPDSEALALLSQLGQLCPLVASFSCHISFKGDSDSSKAISQSISQSVVCWTGLKKLSTPVLTVDAYQHLSRLPHFSHLRLHCDYMLSIFPSPPSFVGFGSLRKLHIEECPLIRAIGILKVMKTSTLERVYLYALDIDDPLDHWEEYFNLVAQRTSKASRLELIVDGVVVNEDPSAKLDKNVLRTFLIPPQRLTVLDFSDFYYFDLDDDLIKDIAKASPNLITLEIGTRRAIPSPPTLTLNAYYYVFKHCPKIKILGLVVDTDTSLIREDNADDGKCIETHGSGFFLLVGSSVVEDSSKVAAFLSQFFFEHIRISTVDHGHSPNSKGWEEVSRELAELIEGPDYHEDDDLDDGSDTISLEADI